MKNFPQKTSFSWGQILAQNIDRINSFKQWNELVDNRIYPELQNSIHLIDNIKDNKNLSTWAQSYRFVFLF
jgi:hypothetical protein